MTQKQFDEFREVMNDYTQAKMIEGSLTEAISWIGDNLEPDDVFKEDALLKFASNYDPESVFENGELESWAEKEGYTKE